MRSALGRLIRRRILSALLLGVSAAPTLATEPTFIQSAGRQIEVFVMEPSSGGRHPAVLFVHGYQRGPAPPGAAELTAGGDDSLLVRTAQRGYVAAAVSQPGFGRSEGPPDFCGPATQAAIRAALAYLRGLPSVDPDRIVLFGHSRGAVASGMVAAEEPTLKAVILMAGLYDLASLRPHPNTEIEELVQRESGGSPDALGARSPLRVVDRIRSPVLLLHGRSDAVAPVNQAELFAKALQARGVDVTLALFNAGHSIPPRQRGPAIDAFLQRVLGR